MIVLFINGDLVFQYHLLVNYLLKYPQNKIYCIAPAGHSEASGVTTLHYKKILSWRQGIHEWTHKIDEAIGIGTAIADVCVQLRDQGVHPDIIIGHSGWGETLYAKDIFPDAKVLVFSEYYYRMKGADLNFDPEFPIEPHPSRARARNSIAVIAFDSSDWGYCPTRWQYSLHPEYMRRRTSLLHEGFDTDVLKPNSNASVTIEDKTLTSNDEVIVYISRSLEPYRGFHSFMRALPAIQMMRPKAQTIIIGKNDVTYGIHLSAGATWRGNMLHELGDQLDLSRIHFLGKTSREVVVSSLQIASAYIHLTYPFILSWSFIEAMCIGAPIIGSKTPPVEEFLVEGVNGLLVDFFDYEGIADRVNEAITNTERTVEMRRQARKMATDIFDFKEQTLYDWLLLLQMLMAGEKPPINLTYKRLPIR